MKTLHQKNTMPCHFNGLDTPRGYYAIRWVIHRLPLILNNEGKVVFSTDGVVYSEHFQEKDYMIQEQKSKVTNIQYAYAVPDTYFVKRRVYFY